MARIEAEGASGRTVTLKLKFSDFTQITRAKSVGEPVGTREAVRALAKALLDAEPPPPRSVRLIGVTLSNLAGDEAAEPVQPRLDVVFDPVRAFEERLG